MGTEIELKLSLPPAGLKKFRRRALLASFKSGRGVTRFQKSVYFDTPAFDLRQREVVLRIRHIGRRRIQTIKTMGEQQSGASVRGEWEREIAGDRPDLSTLAPDDLARLFGDGAPAQDLQPIFSTEVRRTTYRLGDGDWEIELALDDGQLVAGKTSIPISEAELELRRGEPRRLFDVALALQGGLPARISGISKAERGYFLLTGERPGPRKAPHLTMAAEISTADALKTIARSSLGQFLANQDCLVETGDPEALHQMRVALRRLRSAIGIFKTITDTPDTALLRQELRWLQGPLGAARDNDVFIAQILEPLAAPLGAEPGYTSFRNDFEDRRQATQAAAKDVLAQPRFARLMLLLGQWIESGLWQNAEDDNRRSRLDEPARLLAQATLAEHYRKARRAMRTLADQDSAERHRTRIRVKKLRYAADFFASLFANRKGKRFYTQLSMLQDRLGLLNDIAVSQRLLREYAQGSGDHERFWAGGMIAGWHGARVATLIAKAEDDWQACDKWAKFWRNGNP